MKVVMIESPIFLKRILMMLFGIKKEENIT